MRKIVRAMHSQKGFTLIELLVVVGILAALAGVVTLAVTQFMNRGQDEANCTELHNVQTAAAAAMVDDGDPSDWATFTMGQQRCDYTVDASSGEATQDSCPSGALCN